MVHRDDRGRRHAVLQILEVLGRDDVVGTDNGAPCRVILDARQAQPGGRIDDREIGADLVEPLVEEMRHHRRRAVISVAGLASPEARHRHPAPAALLDAHQQRVAGHRHRGEEPVRRQITAHLAHLLTEHRIVLDPMAVAVDDRVIELGADLRRGEVGVTAHEFPPRRGSSRAAHRQQAERRSACTRKGRAAIDFPVR